MQTWKRVWTNAIAGAAACGAFNPLSRGDVSGVATFPASIVVEASLSEADEAQAFDIDRDGDLDVLAVARAGNTVAWWENTNGLGTAWARHNISTALNRASGAWAADLDDDGDVDVISGSFNADDVVWYRNEGDNLTWTLMTIDANFDGAAAFEAADVDGDGDLDLFSAGQNANDVVWYRNDDGAGTAWTKITIDPLLGGATYVAPVDMNGDGKMDVVGAGQTGDLIAWYENLGGGLTWTRHSIGSVDLAASAVPVDMDGDGDWDVVGAAFTDNDVVWFENTDGVGGAWTRHDINTDFTFAIYANAADLDFDGDMDVLAIGHNLGEVTWFENVDGAGTSWSEHPIMLGFALATFGAIADFNGDSRPDVLACAAVANQILWWANTGGQFQLAAASVALPTIGELSRQAALKLDLTHIGRAGDDEIGLSSVALRLESAAGVPLTDLQANGLLISLELFRDTGSGDWDAGDELVGTWTPTALSSEGELSLSVLDESAVGVRLGVGETKTYFVVLSTTASASAFGVNELRVTHVLAKTQVEDRSKDMPLLSTAGGEVTAGPVNVLDSVRPGDTDGDGDVDLSDLGVVLAAYNYCFGTPGYVAAADYNGSGCVDLSDLGVVLAEFGT